MSIKEKKNGGFVKDEYIKDIATLNLGGVKTTLGDKITDIKLLIPERNSQIPSQRKALKSPENNDNFEDDGI